MNYERISSYQMFTLWEELGRNYLEVLKYSWNNAELLALGYVWHIYSFSLTCKFYVAMIYKWRTAYIRLKEDIFLSNGKSKKHAAFRVQM